MTDAEQADDGTPPDALISLRRTRRGALDLLRAYRVVLDGGEVADIRPGQIPEFNVLPGSHTIQVALDRGASPLVSVDLSTEVRAAFVGGQQRKSVSDFGSP